MNSDLQKQCEELVQIKGEIEENLMKAEQMHQSFVAETSQRISKLQRRHFCSSECCYWNFSCPGEQGKRVAIFEWKIRNWAGRGGELKNNHLLQESLKELQFLSETLSLEKKELEFHHFSK